MHPLYVLQTKQGSPKVSFSSRLTICGSTLVTCWRKPIFAYIARVYINRHACFAIAILTSLAPSKGAPRLWSYIHVHVRCQGGTRAYLGTCLRNRLGAFSSLGAFERWPQKQNSANGQARNIPTSRSKPGGHQRRDLHDFGRIQHIESEVLKPQIVVNNFPTV